MAKVKAQALQFYCLQLPLPQSCLEHKKVFFTRVSDCAQLQLQGIKSSFFFDAFEKQDKSKVLKNTRQFCLLQNDFFAWLINFNNTSYKLSAWWRYAFLKRFFSLRLGAASWCRILNPQVSSSILTVIANSGSACKYLSWIYENLFRVGLVVFFVFTKHVVLMK